MKTTVEKKIKVSSNVPIKALRLFLIQATTYLCEARFYAAAVFNIQFSVVT